LNWFEIIVPVGAADVDDVAALIVSEVPSASAGIEQRGDEVVFWVAADGVARAIEEVRIANLAIDAAKIRSAPAVPEADWRDAWKKYFKVSRLTRQFVVVPSWETFAPGPDDIAIDLDPGMAFGTGTHASTRLVLEEIQTLADAGAEPARILDLGCGSGILAIAAVKRWPRSTCVAVDNDPLAVTACAENAATNHVGERVVASAIPATGTFSLVLANIQAHVLRELRVALIAYTDRTLILSGLLTPQAAPLADEFVAAGMRLVRIRASTDDPAWSCVVLDKP
jgi:ribosomal protein L11 methyltransferase